MIDKNKVKIWLSTKLVEPIKHQLKTGYSVETISMSIAVGLAIACTPILGISTILGIIIASIFSLNHVVLQTINYIAYPLHLALIIPFLMLGQRVFAKHIVPLKLSRMTQVFEQGPLIFFKTYGMIVLHGMLLWLVAVPFIIGLTYFTVRPLIRKLAALVKTS